MCWRNSNNKVAADNEEKWWSKGWIAILKIRELSEIMAGPRWKTFIRRFNKNNNKGGGRFQYDPLSYALNFDEGTGHSDHQDEDRVFRDFSFRFASIPISAKSSMDLGRDAPSFA
ncbi:hypothetical protein NE237_019946 [Protea cynaroides]|uniref:Uncharacterized protein n=1 Tax=Protea cynaroides TaxID=273540 RepID=A0A9Q0H531_9MAGN|nr:hypothetical protein NE237_019946 [Protea cynaroides]